MTTASVLVAQVDDVVRIDVAGEIDLYNAAEIERQIGGGIPNDVTLVRLDLADISYIDSAGMRILFTIAERLRNLQIALVVIAPPGTAARRLADICALDTVATVQP